MGAKIDWTALPIMVEMLGIADVEDFIVQLETIRDYQDAAARAAAAG